MMQNIPVPAAFFQACDIIDADHPAVLAKAQQLALGANGASEIAQRCFEFVRDQIQHSSDFKRNPVTLRASDVLAHGTGYCYAKSHLLAALLRANGIPAGMCYQRLTVGDDGEPYCLHGLNALYLPEYGWYRVDARGNKPGVNAQFCPPQEQLAFAIRPPQELDFPGVYAKPVALICEALRTHATYDAVLANLPDAAVLPQSSDWLPLR